MVAIALLVCGDVFALSPDKAISQYAASTWQSDAGLPELVVEGVTSTADGFLWVATQGGLARFDGRNFEVFNRSNTPTMRSDFIISLAPDENGGLWVGTDNGLLHRSRDGVFSVFTHSDGLPADIIYSLLVDGAGGVWVGTIGGLAHIVAGHVVATYTSSDGLDSDVIVSLVLSDRGTLWIGTRQGADELQQDGRLRAFGERDGVRAGTTRVFATRNGEIWATSRGNPIARYKSDGQFHSWWPRDIAPGTWVNAICEDRDGNMWMSTDSHGVYRGKSTAIDTAVLVHGLADLPVTRLHEDSTGNLWIGTNGRGLTRLRDGSFTTYSAEQGLASDTASVLLQDPEGPMWVGTIDGLTRISTATVERMGVGDGLSSNSISALALDHGGRLLVGAFGPSLDILENRNVVSSARFKTPDASSFIQAIVEDRRKTLWLGTDGGGLIRVIGNDTKYLTTRDGLPGNFVNILFIDMAGSLWVGTNRGLARIEDDGVVRNYPATSDLGRIFILSITQDSRGVMWIGTFGQGLYRVEADTVTHIDRARGLDAETINSLLFDADDNLWIGTNNGVVRADRSDLDALSQGQIARLTVARFGQADGLKNAETRSGRQPSAWRGNDGRLWFAAVEGVAVVDPSRVRLSEMPMNVVISRVLVDGESLAVNQHMQLKGGASRVEFAYTAPNLTDAENTHFRYRLSGIDNDWVEVDDERAARYVNIPPGDHTFEVQARQSAGHWSGRSASVSLYLPALFYETWWFKLWCFAMIAFAAGLAHYARTTRLRARSAVAEERQRIAGEIHDNLAQGFNAISLQIEAAMSRMMRSPDLAADHLKIASDVSRSSLREARKSVWALESPEAHTSSLAGSMQAMASQLSSTQRINVRVRIHGKPWVASSVVENHLLRIVQEAVSNARNHGKALHVHVHMGFEFHRLTLSISDDGCGFDMSANEADAFRGFGLRSIRRRVQSLKGQLQLHTSPNAGTRILMTIPRNALLGSLSRSTTGA